MADTHGHQNAEHHDRLRRSARDLLDKGSTPRNSSGTLSIDALQLLYQQASTPESATDVLRLLHELQTHQVELDLLYEQLQASEQDMSEQLAYYKLLYDRAPAPCLVVSGKGEIVEGNQAAEMFFGEPAGALGARTLSSLLPSDQQAILKTLLVKLGAKAPGDDNVESAVIELPYHRAVLIRARPTGTGNSILMILTEAATPSVGS
jgi:PAS domain-containing protein